MPAPEPRGAGTGTCGTLEDGTGLHDPIGELTIEAASGYLCCYLCGRWFAFLGAHVRVHGYTAAVYRSAMGLCIGEPLICADLSLRIATRQAKAYTQDEQMRERLSRDATPRDDARAGTRPAGAFGGPEAAQRVARRRAALRAGPETMADRRRVALVQRLHGLGYRRLEEYLRDAYTAGASLEHLASATGLGRERLRAELAQAGVQIRPTGQNTPAGRSSRARSADIEVRQRLGIEDLPTWLSEKHSAGWTLTRLGQMVGHSSHWVRSRLPLVSAS